MRTLAFHLRGFGRDRRGVAALEMALMGSMITMLLLNVVEVARYAATATQVAAASQAGAYAAIGACAPEDIPVKTNCPNLQTAVEDGIRGGSLSTTGVFLKGSIAEAWYCVNDSGSLQLVSSADDKPDDCQAVGDPATDPGLYIQVQAEKAYEPLFPGLTIVQGMSATIVRTAWMRVA